MNANDPRRLPSKRSFGKDQEILAANYLHRQGLKLLRRNFQCRLGEIDLILLDSEAQLVFVEVRYRQQVRYGSAIESVDCRKQRKIRITAEYFLQANPKFAQLACRFDVIGIEPEAKDGRLKFHWIKNAFN